MTVFTFWRESDVNLNLINFLSNYLHVLYCRGIVFGFKVIDANCDVSYDVSKLKRGDTWERDLIEEKLLTEMSGGILLWAIRCPAYVHRIFVPKTTAGCVVLLTAVNP